MQNFSISMRPILNLWSIWTQFNLLWLTSVESYCKTFLTIFHSSCCFRLTLTITASSATSFSLCTKGQHTPRRTDRWQYSLSWSEQLSLGRKMKQIEKLPLLSLAGRGIGFLLLPTADDIQTWGGGLYQMTGFIL